MALECEISIFSFWEMTLEEIVQSIEAYGNRRKNILRERALMDYKLAQGIGLNVANLFDDENNVPEFVEFYAELFEEKNKKIQEQKRLNELEINKQRMKEFANFHNKRFRREG